MTSAPTTIPAVQSSWLASPRFFPMMAVILVVGHTCDLIGTYIGQPNLETEANWIYRAFHSFGYRPGFGWFIAGKVAATVLGLFLLRLFLNKRRSYYPSGATSFRDFILGFLYQRRLTWIQSLYSLPRDWRPLLLYCGAFMGLGGPYYIYLGYENLAVGHGWWTAPDFYIGRISVDSFAIVFVCAVIAVVTWQLWVDYQAMSLTSPLA